jgi:pimeloyl-ACP methyl ester carboxylesterase
MVRATSFRSPKGEAAFMATYDAAMKLWPLPYDETDIPSRFGTTHVAISGSEGSPPLVLLHGYSVTSAMWSPNIADFCKDYRVYAIDVMGQPGKSVPAEPIREPADFVEWLNATLDGLGLGRVRLAGMSFGGWLGIHFALAAPERVHKLALLSPAGFLPMAKQFMLRSMLLTIFPSRVTANSFMKWMGASDKASDPASESIVDLFYLGMKYFRMPSETVRIMPSAFSDDQFCALNMPVLLLFGAQEVIYDPARALERARQLVPDLTGELVPNSSHNMCLTQKEIVDARLMEFMTGD